MSHLPVDIDDETIQFDDRWLGREDLAREVRAMLDGGNYNIGRHSAALETLNQALTGVETLAFRLDSQLADALTAAAAREGRTPGAIIREAVARLLGQDSVVGTAGGEGGAGTHEPAQEYEAAPAHEVQDVAAVAPEAQAQAPLPVSASIAAQPEPATPVFAAELMQTQPNLQVPAHAPVPAPAPVFAAPPGLHAPVAGPGALRSAGVTPPPSVVVDESLVNELAARSASTSDAPASKKDAEPLDAVERRWFGG